MPPHIVFFSIDALRYDFPAAQPETAHHRAIGVEREEATPVLDSWIARGAFFPRAASVATYTTAAHASVLTGLYPPRHGVRPFLKTTLYPEARTLPEILGEAGYRCVLYSDGARFFRLPGLGRGFHAWVSSEQALFEELERAAGPVFLLVHCLDVHAPYLFSWGNHREGVNEDFFLAMDDLSARLGRPPIERPKEAGPAGVPRRFHEFQRGLSALPDGRALQFDLYRRGARKFDGGRFAFLMEGLTKRLPGDLFLACFSDHGEGFYPDRPVMTHSGALTEEIGRIVFLLWFPSIAPRIIEAPVSLVDLLPTALSYAGLKERADRLPGGFDGLDLLPALRGGPLPERSLYQEVWVCEKRRDRPAGPRRAEGWRLVMADHVLHQRALRRGALRLVVTGREDPEARRELAQASVDRFPALCRAHLLGLPERSPPDRWIHALAERLFRWSGGPAWARRLALRAIRGTRVFRGRPTYLLHDWTADPRADRPLFAGAEPDPAFEDLLLDLRRVSDLSRPPAPEIRIGAPQEGEQMLEQLAALGYGEGGNGK